jgi:signal transduction histidine kinase
MLDEPAGHRSAAPATATRPRVGLAARVMALIVLFVMIAEVAIYVPSMASFRDAWLRDRLAAAYTAALTLEAAPQISDELRLELLSSVGAKVIVMKMHNTRRLLAESDMPPKVDETYDLRTATPVQSIKAAFDCLLAPPGRILDVYGDAPMGGDFIVITIDEGPLRAAMVRYSINILILSLLISAVVATFAVFAITIMVLRPIRRLTSNLIAFGENPEDQTRIIAPSAKRDEIGIAEEALARMQRSLVHELATKKHLAALGLAVAKINHDLRNMLTSAQLLSDRLALLPDPVARRLAPKLMATLDRAISFCQSTLAYGRIVERPVEARPVALGAVAQDALDTVAPDALSGPELVNSVPADVVVEADAEHLFRILMNLARNATEALASAPSGPGQGRVEINARRSDGCALIEVSDNGPGIPAAARARLFEAFQGSSRPGGTGLGLSIAADLTRAHGGTIELLEGPRPGATFRVTLPLRFSDRRTSHRHGGDAPMPSVE